MQKMDLDQIGKLVRKIVREEVETEAGNIKDSLEHEIRTSSLHLRDGIRELGDRTKNIEVKLTSVDNSLNAMEKEVKSARKDIRKLQKDVNVAIDVFNVEDTKLARRVRRIENHLALPE